MMLMTMVKENIAVLFQQVFSLMRQTLNYTKLNEAIYN